MEAGRIPSAKAGPTVALVLGLAAIAAYVSVALVLVDRTSFDVWGAVLLAPILIGVSVPIAPAPSDRGKPIRAPSACCSSRWS